MQTQDILTITGLIFNTAAAIILIFPNLNIKKKLDDDYIIASGKNGEYTQKKHLKERRLNLFGLTLLATGFILQLLALFSA